MQALVDQRTVAGWATDLDAVHARLGSRFGQAAPRRQVRTYVESLLGPIERKHGWQVAEYAGEATPCVMTCALT